MQCQCKLLCCLSVHLALVLRVTEVPCSLCSLAPRLPTSRKLGARLPWWCVQIWSGAADGVLAVLVDSRGQGQLEDALVHLLKSPTGKGKTECTCSRHATAVSRLFSPCCLLGLAEASHQLCCLCGAELPSHYWPGPVGWYRGR